MHKRKFGQNLHVTEENIGMHTFARNQGLWIDTLTLNKGTQENTKAGEYYYIERTYHS